jgi:hypothetical protein
MDWHPNDDELIVHAYGDGAQAEQASIEAHLRRCAACRTELEALRASLSLATEADVPEPGPDFEDAIWRRIQAALSAAGTAAARSGASAPGQTASAPEPQAAPATLSGGHLLPALAWAAVVLVGLALGILWTRADRSIAVPPPAAVTDPAAPAPGGDALRERVLLTALDQHFGETELLLVELLNAPAQGPNAGTAGTLAFERAAASDLVASGRLFRETAEETGQRQLADVLDELESVLVEVARSPDDLPPATVDRWRAQIEDRSLLFKVRAVAHEVRARQDGPPAVHKGAL